MNCETYLALECSPKPPWPTAFEKSKIHQPNLEEFQFEGSKIEQFLSDFYHFSSKTSKNASILLPLNWNSSRLGWWILDFSKAVGQGGFGKYSNAKQVSQFMQTKFSCHKMSQNSTVLAVSYSSDCRYVYTFTYCKQWFHKISQWDHMLQFFQSPWDYHI